MNKSTTTYDIGVLIVVSQTLQCKMAFNTGNSEFGSSSVSSSLSHLFVGSMYDDIRLYAAWSTHALSTSYSDSPFFQGSALTLSNDTSSSVFLYFSSLLFSLPGCFLLTKYCTHSFSLLITMSCPYHLNLSFPGIYGGRLD